MGTLILPGGEDRGAPNRSSNTTQPPGISTRNSSSKDASKHERAEKRTHFIQSGEYIPGSYCQMTCDRRQYVEEKETWTPKPDKCTFKSKGKMTSSCEIFLRLLRNWKFCPIILNPIDAGGRGGGSLFSSLATPSLLPVIVTDPQFIDFAFLTFFN